MLNDSGIRKWLEKHGKQEFIDFNDKEREELRKYFDSIDDTSTGSITASELEDPLISLGLADDKEDVANLVKSVDIDGSGEIEFDEFLLLLKGEHADSPMQQFFKKIIEGSLIEQTSTIPF
jgi:centrin-1